MTPEDQEREQAIRARLENLTIPGGPYGGYYQDVPWLLDRLAEERELREAAEAVYPTIRGVMEAYDRWRALRGER